MKGCNYLRAVISESIAEIQGQESDQHSDFVQLKVYVYMTLLSDHVKMCRTCTKFLEEHGTPVNKGKCSL
jgi:hypothetical protein